MYWKCQLMFYLNSSLHTNFFVKKIIQKLAIKKFNLDFNIYFYNKLKQKEFYYKRFILYTFKKKAF